MFHRLFEKPESKLSPIEAELKYSNPDADNWHFRLYPLPFPDNLEAELNYKIVHHGTLHPQGLNPEIKFTSKEQFYIFAENYVKFMRERSKSKKTEYSSLTVGLNVYCQIAMDFKQFGTNLRRQVFLSHLESMYTANF